MLEPSELGGFLRARRESLTPADVGLRDSGRRRTPGLRREEVAALAGVSIDYLVRLEQGRDTKPSMSVIAALADALRLPEDARNHLARLALINSSQEMCPTAVDAAREVPDTVRTLLDHLAPTPAFVLAPYADVLAWNDPWDALVRPIGLLDRPEPNLAWFTFGDARARSLYPDWDSIAADHSSSLRAASLRWGKDARMEGLLEELLVLPAFAERWSAHAVSEKRRGETRLAHPEHGPLRIAVEVLLLPDGADQRLVTWLPADDAARAAFSTLGVTDTPVSPAVLRVVGEG
jgi:transcriptional regulator with XRE-family HTH domain